MTPFEIFCGIVISLIVAVVLYGACQSSELANDDDCRRRRRRKLLASVEGKKKNA